MASPALAHLAMTLSLLHTQQTPMPFGTGGACVEIAGTSPEGMRVYKLSSDAPLRDNLPADGQVTIAELPGHQHSRTGNVLFDALYALALQEAGQNAVNAIRDGSYAHGRTIEAEVFQTGELWNYVWTRDLAYALHLGLANFDPQRAAESLRFKSSLIKATALGGYRHQIVQDTGSGGSYPVSTDRIVWALGAHETLKQLPVPQREAFLREIYPYLRDTLEQDRRLVFDPRDGLYCGEQSFLDWREQSYPAWTANDVRVIAQSKALSVNAAYAYILGLVAGYAEALGHTEESARYASWAEALRAAVQVHFYDADSGLYRTYLLSESGTVTLPAQRYDLLGLCFAVLFGIADESQAKRALAAYPYGPYGPPVVWPQASDQPIYHNQGIWPFVTAYWLKAARHTGNAAIIDAAVRSLMQQASANLSNMENFDLVSGLAEVTHGPRTGPVINSRRQLWSVAGYLSLVQDSVFGVDFGMDRMRVAPAITAQMRRELFADNDTIELLKLPYLGTSNDIRVYLPDATSFTVGIAVVREVRLNGSTLAEDGASRDELCDANLWEVFLETPADAEEPVPLAYANGKAALCAPPPAEWVGDGVSPAGQHLRLRYTHPDADAVVFDIYRDGRLRVEGVRETAWTDPDSGNFAEQVRIYQVVVRDPESGLSAYPTREATYRLPSQVTVIPAKSLLDQTGKVVGKPRLLDWGASDESLTAESFTVAKDGVYTLRVNFANGSGPINTGITCAVKRLEVTNCDTGEIVGAGYVIMPQSGDWTRFDLSNVVPAELQASTRYTLRLYEDTIARNMSYLEGNATYTALPGGGRECYNRIHLAGIHVLYQNPLHP